MGLEPAIKAAVFPHSLGNIVGVGLEFFGHGSEITFSSPATQGLRLVQTSGSSIRR